MGLRRIVEVSGIKTVVRGIKEVRWAKKVRDLKEGALCCCNIC